MSAVFQQLLVLYIFCFVGWLFGRIDKRQEERSALLSFLLVNLFLPCKIISSFSKNFTVPYLKSNYVTFIISFCAVALFVTIALFVSRLLSKKPYERNVYRYSLTIANYAYLGYVLVEAVWGEIALTNMILYCMPFVFYTYTFGYVLLTGGKWSFRRLANPMTVSLVVGAVLGLTGIQLPNVFETVLSNASACTGPVSMLLTGLVISPFKPKELLPDRSIIVFCIIRLMGLSLLMLGICTVLGMIFELPDAVYPYAVVMACMPCGLNTVIFPKLIGEDCRLGARMALYSHALSLITIPLWVYILT